VNRLRRTIGLASVLLLAGLGSLQAQFVPEVGGNALYLGRSAGLALTNEEATGAINPAALPVLFRMPPVKSVRTVSVSGSPPAGSQAGLSPSPADLTLVLPARPRLVFASSWGEPSGEQVALAPYLGDVSGALLGDTQPLQVQIESRFLTVDQTFLREVGVGLEDARAIQAGYTTATGENADLNSYQAVLGRIGQGTGLGLGYLREFDDKSYYVAAGKVLNRGSLPPVASAPQVTAFTNQPAMISVGAKLAYHDLMNQPSRITVDLAVQASADRTLVDLVIRPSIALVYRDATNAYGDLAGRGSRLDAGIGVTGEHFSLGIDMVDVFNQQASCVFPDAGRQVNYGVQFRWGVFSVSGGVAGNETSWALGATIPLGKPLASTVTVPEGRTVLLGGLKLTGQQVQETGVPLMGRIPLLGQAFSQQGRERNQTTLLTLITPHVIVGED